MSKVRDALVDFTNVVVTNGDILSYLKDALGVAVLPGEFAPKPQVVDPLDDLTIDTNKWAVSGTVVEGPYLGRDCLIMSSPATPSYDACGVIYKPKITPSIGSMVHARFIMTDNIEWLVGLQEFAFTVDNPVTPSTWTLKYAVAQVPDNSTYLRFRPGRIQVVRGGATGQFIDVPNSAWLASHPTDVSKQYPVLVAFVFTQTGFQIFVHQPGVWDAPKLVHTEVRSNYVQPAYGYALCVNKYTSDSQLGFFYPSTGFRNDCVVSSAVIRAANLDDLVYLNSLVPSYEVGGIMGQGGYLAVRFPTYSPVAFSLEQLAELTSRLSGYHQYPVEFVLSGDVILRHPTRINIMDTGLAEVAPSAPATT